MRKVVYCFKIFQPHLFQIPQIIAWRELWQKYHCQEEVPKQQKQVIVKLLILLQGFVDWSDLICCFLLILHWICQKNLSFWSLRPQHNFQNLLSKYSWKDCWLLSHQTFIKINHSPEVKFNHHRILLSNSFRRWGNSQITWFTFYFALKKKQKNNNFPVTIVSRTSKKMFNLQWAKNILRRFTILELYDAAVSKNLQSNMKIVE